MGGLQEVLLVLGVFRWGGPLGARDPLSDDGNGVRTEAELPQPGVTQALGGAGPVPGEGQGRRVSRAHHSDSNPRTASLHSLWRFDQQLADEVDGELGHPGEGVPAVVHADLGHVQKGLLLVVPSEGGLPRHQHVGDDPHAPEGTNRKHLQHGQLGGGGGLTCF